MKKNLAYHEVTSLEHSLHHFNDYYALHPHPIIVQTSNATINVQFNSDDEPKKPNRQEIKIKKKNPADLAYNRVGPPHQARH